MAMGTRKQREKQEDIWIAHTELPSAPGHPFYQRLNELLEAEKFDEFVEKRCAKFYAAKYGRPSLTPGIYFRTLLLGYFEGIDSERGIAWRLADSLGLRRFVGIGLDEYTPDHTTISRTRRLIDLGTHGEVFGWVLGVLADRGLLKGKRIAIDATTLEANAAMRSIVRRDTGESYEEFLRGLAKASGIETPSREDLARLDRKRKKRMPNKDWKSPVDGDARITKMKDGRTHLAHKAEHAVDLDTGAVVAVTLQGADLGDTVTLDVTLTEAGMAVAELVKREAGEQRPEDKPKVNVEGIEEVVADKGYHSGAVLERVKSYEVRTYIPEKKQAGQRHWEGKTEEQQAVYQNRRRVRGGYGKSLLRRRGELVERSFAHCYETGGMRRTHLRGHENILKRQLVHVGAFNLSLILRQVLGAGTPRQWKDLAETHFLLFIYYLLVGKIEIRSPEAESQYLARNGSSNHETRLADRRRWSCRKLATSTPGCYGCGVFVSNKGDMVVIEHGGSIDGFNSYMIYVPARDIAVIALSNVSGDAPDKMAAKLLDVTLGKAVTLADRRVAVPIAKAELLKFVGEYAISAQLSLNIAASDDGLIVLATGQPPLQFSYEGEISGHPQFFTRAMDAQIEFIPTTADHVSTLVLHLGGAAMTGKRQ
jgi:transposase